MKNILLIEDEENLNRGISLKLKKEGYAVFSAACVSEGLKLFQDNTIDLVICDIGLPDGSGLDLCANIRQRSDVLFLFLTALDTEVDVITGYEMGADDYVTKPFSMSVLVSKISAMLKRTEKAVSNIVQTGKLTFYIDEKRVVKGDNAISITPTDWKLLMAFIEHPHHTSTLKPTGGTHGSMTAAILPPAAMCSIMAAALWSGITGWRIFPRSTVSSPIQS